MQAKAEVIYNGPEPFFGYSASLSALLTKKTYFDMVGIAVDIFNKHIDEWNQEYTNLGLPEDGGTQNSIYDDWIGTKMDPVAEAITALAPKNDYISSYFIEHGDSRLCAKLINGTTMMYKILWDTLKGARR